MNQSTIVEMNDFDLTPESFRKLKETLKDGNIVRNPFAKFFSDGNVTTLSTGEKNMQMK